ncbi:MULTISPECIES: HalOD1 output domain-containing protein [Haloarcula]|uniref:HalOD1 output domain-containing protein n=1 Tax=Haloarcula TaxID=2237 RepID=UPI0023EC871F|nr:HalOD1 output domain-containing protein [Halomicroarcula sp. XH51]
MTDSDRGAGHDPTADADGVVRAEYDWSSVTPSTAVIETVAIARNSEPTGFEPMYHSVDTDALNALFGSDGRHAAGGVSTVSFAFAGHDVTVRDTGLVVIQPTESRHESA